MLSEVAASREGQRDRSSFIYRSSSSPRISALIDNKEKVWFPLKQPADASLLRSVKQPAFLHWHPISQHHSSMGIDRCNNCIEIKGDWYKLL